MVEVTKHFKIVGVVVMALLAIVLFVGWNNKSANRKITNSAPVAPTPTNGGTHPNLVSAKKKPCNVCQAKKMQQFEQKMQRQEQNNWI